MVMRELRDLMKLARRRGVASGPTGPAQLRSETGLPGPLLERSPQSRRNKARGQKDLLLAGW